MTTVLTSDLIYSVRFGTDEENTADLSDAKILDALNRSQLQLTRLAGRHFPEMLKRTYSTSTFTGRTFAIPNESAAFTVNQVDIIFGVITYRVDYTNTTNVTQYETNNVTAIPVKYTLQGNIISLYPQPQGGVTCRVRYQLRPPKLVASFGRITSFDTVNGYIYMDSIPTVAEGGPSTNTSDLTCFINVINQYTGDVTGTYQIVAIDYTANKITIKSTALYRTTVYGRSVSIELSASIVEDDYVTSAQGSCIPIYFSDFADYLVQHAIVEIKRSFDTNVEDEIEQLKKLEDDVKEMWSSRPTGVRVQPRNKAWNRSFYRKRL